MKAFSGSLVLLAVFVSVQAEEAPTAAVSAVAAEAPFACTASNDIEPICGFAGPPEDLEDLPDGRIIVGEYGAMSGAKPGRLTLLDPATKTRSTLYDGQAAATVAAAARARDVCPGAPGPQFSPHGIHLALVDGKQRLLVVNHGGREAIEIFDVQTDPATKEIAVTWRDCVPAPDYAWINDVVNLPDGGLAATHMVQRGVGAEVFRAAEASRVATGHVLQWQVDTGWEKVPGSEGSLPNGIEASADGRVLYVAQYLGDRVVALDRLSGKQLWAAEVPAPDNVTIAPSGELLVASHREPFEAIEHCAQRHAQACGLTYAIVGLHADTGAQRIVLNGAGAPMGAATVALQVGDALYLGSFVGERIVVRPVPAP